MFRPVELQTILPRAVDVQRIQQTHNSRSVTEQQDLSREFLKTNQELREQIEQSNASEEGTLIREEEENKEKRERRQSRRGRSKKDEAPTEEAAVDTERGRHIDIKI